MKKQKRKEARGCGPQERQSPTPTPVSPLHAVGALCCEASGTLPRQSAPLASHVMSPSRAVSFSTMARCLPHRTPAHSTAARSNSHAACAQHPKTSESPTAHVLSLNVKFGSCLQMVWAAPQLRLVPFFFFLLQVPRSVSTTIGHRSCKKVTKRHGENVRENAVQPPKGPGVDAEHRPETQATQY